MARCLFSPNVPVLRAAGFQTCCVAGFQAGITGLPPAGLETRDIADLEVCATLLKRCLLLRFEQNRTRLHVERADYLHAGNQRALHTIWLSP
jgi:hypothetical protein